MTAVSPRRPRSYLYIPGDRPDRLAKGLTRGADALIADLEDAVTPDHKDAALEHVDAWLADQHHAGAQIWVRVNTDPGRQAAELRRLAHHSQLAGFLLPKIEQPDTVRVAAELLDRLGCLGALAPMIESATGLVNIHQIARITGVYQLHLGEMDFAADLGLDPNPADPAGTELLYARSLVVVASRAAGLVAPAAPVTAEINGTAHFEATTRHLRRLGFHGRDCIHPRQVELTNPIFTPTADELAWAAEVLESARSSPGAFRDGNGAMVDEAVLRSARALLANSTGQPVKLA
jgi:citrate lyase subunit beta/citryl-CoA lyase